MPGLATQPNQFPDTCRKGIFPQAASVYSHLLSRRGLSEEDKPMLKDLPRTAPAEPWIRARASLDPSIRRMIYGPIRPMSEPGFLSRIFRWR